MWRFVEHRANAVFAYGEFYKFNVCEDVTMPVYSACFSHAVCM